MTGDVCALEESASRRLTEGSSGRVGWASANCENATGADRNEAKATTDVAANQRFRANQLTSILRIDVSRRAINLLETWLFSNI